MRELLDLILFLVRFIYEESGTFSDAAIEEINEVSSAAYRELETIELRLDAIENKFPDLIAKR